MNIKNFKIFIVLVMMFGVIGLKPIGTKAASTAFIWPSAGTVTSEFGPRGSTFHNGIDIANVRGTTVKSSANNGIVTRADGGCIEGNSDCYGGRGNVVYVTHNFNGNTFVTVYQHLSTINVTLGQAVSQGQKIGEVGSTGDSTGPHLHFEVHIGSFGNPVDPRRAFNGEFDSLTYSTYGSYDQFRIYKDRLFISGWHIDSRLTTDLSSAIFVMNADTNQEITRYHITRTERNDVAAAYPQIPLAKNSGFVVDQPLPIGSLNKNIKIISRYSTDPYGNYGVSDYSSKTIPSLKTENRASLDRFEILNGHIIATGWHLPGNVVENMSRVIFILDADTGKEITRKKIDGFERTDVNDAYPTLYGSTICGFILDIPIPAEAKGKKLQVMSRYSPDPYGNYTTSEYKFSKIIIGN